MSDKTLSSTDQKQDLQADAKPVIPESPKEPVDNVKNMWQLFKSLAISEKTAISSTNLQIGNNNTMNVTSSPMEPAKVIDEESLKPYLESERKITKADLKDIPFLGSDWKGVGRELGVDNDIIEAISEDYRRSRECTYQLLLVWIEKKTSNCTVGVLAKALKKYGNHECILKLPIDG